MISISITSATSPWSRTCAIDPNLNIQPSYEFLDYLNEQRAALGLPELEWSDTLQSMCVEKDNNRGLMLHTVANVGEILLQAYDSDVESWHEDFYGSSEHREIMLKDYSWEHTYKPVVVNGVATGETFTYSGPGRAACVVCHYNGYYYVRVQFYAG